MGARSNHMYRGVPAAVIGSAAICAFAAAGGTDAPVFARPFDGVPVATNSRLLRIVPLERINFEDDEQRCLNVGGGLHSLPARLPPRFIDEQTTPSTSGMTVGGAYFGQFVAHDLTLSRSQFKIPSVHRMNLQGTPSVAFRAVL